MRRLIKSVAFITAALLALAFAFWAVTWLGFKEENKEAEFGVTFSTVMARQLGLDPRTLFDAMLDDLEARHIRLPVYWTEAEVSEGAFDFGLYDYFVQKAEAKDAKLVLILGRKLPRWPECYEPEWVQNQSDDSKDQRLFNYIETVVNRYKKSGAVAAWQIENEPFFPFGEDCAAKVFPTDVLEKEVALVKSLDARPIIVTDSGEQGRWLKAAKRADVLGITMYRQVWNPRLGFVYFTFGPGFYRMKHWLLERLIGPKETWVMELQAEPWGPGKILPDYDLAVQRKLMNTGKLRSRIVYARRAGFDTFYLWGAEWWYWLGNKHNDWSLWNEAKMLF